MISVSVTSLCAGAGTVVTVARTLDFTEAVVEVVNAMTVFSEDTQ